LRNERILSRICPSCRGTFTCGGGCRDQKRLEDQGFCYCPVCFKRTFSLVNKTRMKCDVVPLECILKTIGREERVDV